MVSAVCPSLSIPRIHARGFGTGLTVVNAKQKMYIDTQISVFMSYYSLLVVNFVQAISNPMVARTLRRQSMRLSYRGGPGALCDREECCQYPGTTGDESAQHGFVISILLTIRSTEVDSFDQAAIKSERSNFPHYQDTHFPITAPCELGRHGMKNTTR